jgi:hypothetical protein
MSDGIELAFHVEPDEWLDIEQLMLMFHEDNPQVRTDIELSAIQHSILADGYSSECVVVNPWNQKIVAGHGKVTACYEMGYRGALPVIYKEYASEEAHRMAMLKWNKARGHQDPELEKIEVQALVEHIDRQNVAVALAYSAEQLATLLDEVSTIEEEGAERVTRNKSGDEPPDEEWPRLEVQVSPETMQLYQHLLSIAPGDSEGEKVLAIFRCVNPAAYPFLKEKENLQDDEEPDFDLWEEDEE